MKRSGRFMTLGIGMILAGILGMMFHLEPASGILYWYISQGLPVFAAVAGPVLLLIGFFIRDEK